MFNYLRLAPGQVPQHRILHFLFPKKQKHIQLQLKSNFLANPKTMRKLTTIFRCNKPNRPLLSNSKSPIKQTSGAKIASSPSPSSSTSPSSSNQRRKGRSVRNGDLSPRRTKKMRVSSWSVYLIVSSRLPRTYVGVTTNFTRRLKQHNGELKGGAKASSAGRPWSLACIVRGFENRSEACEFESKWKNISKKSSRKKKEENAVNSLLRHREEALKKVDTSFDSSRLKVEWQSTES
ncbi:Structure-specific endonuclease subunit slx1 [Rhynchospora pubera]|uniref:Structure-specific endonuclease subunit slx1 n=1 Tax=Rhynchospora pubera TaxID=906938 RepID=A0AAV8DRP5_9POAL|nr:Structure-specific endonuclease subunit slx1 [Rhynchospora pubera]